MSIAGYSTMYALVPLFASRVGVGTPAGLVGGLAAAVFMPQQMEEILGLASGESLAGVALILLLVACVRRWTAPRRSLGAALALETLKRRGRCASWARWSTCGGREVRLSSGSARIQSSSRG